MINPTDITNRLLDHANTAAAWGDTTTADMMNEAAAAIITLDAELTRVKEAWNIEATANLDLTKELDEARALVDVLNIKLEAILQTSRENNSTMREALANVNKIKDGVDKSNAELQAARARIAALTEARNVEYRALHTFDAYKRDGAYMYAVSRNGYRVKIERGLASEADARAAAQAYIDSLTAPEVTL